MSMVLSFSVNVFIQYDIKNGNYKLVVKSGNFINTDYHNKKRKYKNPYTC